MPLAPKLELLNKFSDQYKERLESYSKLIGAEVQGSRDYETAIHRINKDCDLGWNETDLAIHLLVSRAIDNIKRFGGNEFLKEEHKGSSGEHPYFAALLADEFCRRNNIRGEFRQNLNRGIMLHDNGECLIEFGTVAKQSQNGDQKDIPKTERKVFEYVYTLAAHAVQSGDAEGFFNTVTEIQEYLREESEKPGLEEKIHQKMLENPIPLKPLEHRYRESVDRMIADYEMAEQIKLVGTAPHDQLQEAPNFIGKCCKAVERLEGNLHLLRFNQEDGAKPFSEANSKAILGNIKYCTEILGALRDDSLFGQSDMSQVKATRFITDIRDSIFESDIEILKRAPHRIDLNDRPGEKKRSNPQVRPISNLQYLSLFQKAVDMDYWPVPNKVIGLDGIPPVLARSSQVGIQGVA